MSKASISAAPRHRKGTAVGEKGRLSADAVLNAAAHLLAQDGYASLSLRKIAQAAGMRLGHVQYYFPAKLDIVHGILERYLQRSTERIRERMAAGLEGSEGALQSAIETVLVDQESAEDCAMFREIWALATHDPGVKEAVHRFYLQYRAQVRAILLQLSPKLDKSRADQRAMILVATLEGLSLLRGSDRASKRAGLAREVTLLAQSMLR
ncbi:MAG: TetR/AcrR family transcriptional regulator [Deltaproteobacteria bacterium]|nr:TetR/AcrR family transcriptional regulator [Deltaproteobacteria bacterium]